MNNNRREKVFYIVMIIFYLLFPFTLFFNVYEHRVIKYSQDGNYRVVEKYNIINIKELSSFPFIISILFIIISLVFAVILIIDLYKKKYYTSYVKILSGLSFVLFSGLIFYFSIYLGSLFFFIVCCNLFMLSFDIKINKNKKNNLLIYLPTYLLFIFMLFLALGFQPLQ